MNKTQNQNWIEGKCYSRPLGAKIMLDAVLCLPRRTKLEPSSVSYDWNAASIQHLKKRWWPVYLRHKRMVQTLVCHWCLKKIKATVLFGLFFPCKIRFEYCWLCCIIQCFAQMASTSNTLSLFLFPQSSLLRALVMARLFSPASMQSVHSFLPFSSYSDV